MKLKYIDTLPRHFPSLPSYPRGLGVKMGDVIAVTEKEAKLLKNIKNGNKSVFEDDKPKRIFKKDETIMEE